MNNVRHMFLRDASYNPVGCLAIQLDRRNHRLNYQFSVLNPRDAFNRKLARQLALGRLVEEPFRVNLPRNREVSMHDVTHAVMFHLLNNGKAPTRAVKAAKFWLETASVLAAIEVL